MRLPVVVAVVAVAAAGVTTALAVRGRKAPRPMSPVRFTPTVAAKEVRIAGHVIDRDAQRGIGGVTVVLANAGGELTTATSSDGSYEIVVPPATYRVFVRGAKVLSVGMPERVYIDGGPRRELAGATVDAAMPKLIATRNLTDIDLAVAKSAILRGRVIDNDAKPIADAVVRALGAERPLLGTDIAVTDASGTFELRVPEGRYALEAAHAKFPASTPRLVAISAAAPMMTTLELDPGCIVTGSVDAPADAGELDGAIERNVQDPLVQFGPAAAMSPGGAFRFAARDHNDVTIRAWPWRMAPTPERTFSCYPGAHYDHVKLVVPKREPDLAGTLADATGAAAPYAYLDIKPLDRQGPSLVERTDARGQWRVHDLAAGRYEVTANVAGFGIVVADLTAPSRDNKLQLGGTGRIAGTVSGIVDGAIEVVLESCSDAFDARGKPIAVAHEPRLVVVRGGRFAIDNVPACHLSFDARWHWAHAETGIDVIAGRATTVELDLGVPHQRRVRGTVRDASGAAVAEARVTQRFGERVLGSATSDGDGHFELIAVPGSELAARAGGRTGTALVGRATVDDELVEIVVGDQ